MVIKKGDKVKVEYEGKFEDGTVFDSSTHGDHSHPIEFVVGTGQVVKGFDNAVEGMEKDQEKEFTVSPDEGYGQPNPELKKEIPRTVLPKDQEPKVGAMLVMGMPNGQQIPAKIVAIEKDTVTLDLNHPLAGKKLLFKVKVVEIEAGK
ncbi:peptidylprolyl isomerase [Nanoarchaeota archaeon]